MAAPQWIDFGQKARKFEPQRLNYEAFAYGWRKDTIKVQAQPDGKIWLVPADATFPVKSFPAQPEGFPIEAAEVVDLT